MQLAFCQRLCGFPGIDTDKFDSIQEVEAKVEAVNTFDDGDFFNFHRFESEYKYDAERGAA